MPPIGTAVVKVPVISPIEIFPQSIVREASNVVAVAKVKMAVPSLKSKLHESRVGIPSKNKQQ